MRILLVTPLVPAASATTGGGVVLNGMLRVLAERHDVTLATLADMAADAATLASLAADGVQVHAVPVWRGGGARGALRKARFAFSWLSTGVPLRACAFLLPEFQRTVGALDARTFDLIQVEDVVMGAYDFPAGPPKLLTDHDVRAEDVHWVERARWRRLQRWVWPRFDRIQTFTDLDAARIAALTPAVADRVRVNPFGITPTPPGEAAHGVGILFLGSFKHPPNVDAACWLCAEILPRVRAAVPAARLTIAGADPPRAVRALAGDGVVVTGRVDSLQPYVAAAAVVVAPLRQGGGMRVKVLEAMAAGKAVVATSLAAQGVAEGTARPPLRLADDPPSFAAAIVDLLGDPAARRRLGAEARAHAFEFRSWKRFGERLDRIHRELVDAP